MRDPKIENATTEELKKQAKAIKIVTTVLSTMLALLFVMAIATFETSKVLVAVPLGLLPIVVISIGQIKKINKEISERAAK